MPLISLSEKLDVDGLIYNNRYLCTGDVKSVANARDSGWFFYERCTSGRMQDAEELWNQERARQGRFQVR